MFCISCPTYSGSIKMYDVTGVATQLSLRFQGGKWIAQKSENIEYLTLCHRCSSILHHVFGKIFGYSYKITEMTLTA